MGSVVALGSIIGGGLLAVGLLALPSSPENKLNEVSQPTRFQMKNNFLRIHMQNCDRNKLIIFTN